MINYTKKAPYLYMYDLFHCIVETTVLNISSITPIIHTSGYTFTITTAGAGFIRLALTIYIKK